MEILQPERWRTEDFINVRRRKVFRLEDEGDTAEWIDAYAMYFTVPFRNGFVPSSIPILLVQIPRRENEVQAFFIQDVKIAFIRKEKKDNAQKYFQFSITV